MAKSVSRTAVAAVLLNGRSMFDLSHAAREIANKTERLLLESAGGPARLQIILLLAGMLGLDSADRATVSAVASDLKDVFGIGNTGIGLLVSATSFVGAIFTLPVGVLVDRIHRCNLLIGAVALWTIAMVVSGFSSSFIFLLVTRICLGAVTAAAAPAVASLTGDYFPPRDRAAVYGLILAGELIGTGFGFLVAGEVASWFSWRWSFFVMAVPSVVLIWAAWRFLPEPARGGQSWIELGQEDVHTSDNAKGEREESGGQKGKCKRWSSGP